MTTETATRPGTRRTQPAAPGVDLPTEKTKPTLSFETAKILLYGEQKIGKTTFATELGDQVLLLATEPGYGGLEAFVQPIGSWAEFRAVGQKLAEGKDPFTIFAVDTVDELFRMCQDYVMGQLGVKHPSDLEYGKGWAAVADEFRLRVGRLCSLGRGVLFISHAKDLEVKQRVGTITKIVPSIRGQASEFLLGFVDYILYAAVEDGTDGQEHVIHTAKSEYHAAGARLARGAVPLPDPLPLDAQAVRQAMEASTNPKEKK
jgi:hypothetical protein